MHMYVVLCIGLDFFCYRLLSFDPKTGRVEQLADGLAFANGLQLSVDKSHILISETTKARIMR